MKKLIIVTGIIIIFIGVVLLSFNRDNKTDCYTGLCDFSYWDEQTNSLIINQFCCDDYDKDCMVDRRDVCKMNLNNRREKLK